MEDSEERARIEMTCLQWALGFISVGFADLAAAFARADRAAAEEMIGTLERKVAADLVAERDKLIQRGYDPAPLREVARHVRETIMQAKQQMAAAQKPS
jgi:hypothetical protein